MTESMPAIFLRSRLVQTLVYLATFDDTYGNTWYARWKHIQYTRWKNDPMRLLTWEEMIEDMSLATGHDLFPFSYL